MLASNPAIPRRQEIPSIFSLHTCADRQSSTPSRCSADECSEQSWNQSFISALLVYLLAALFRVVTLSSFVELVHLACCRFQWAKTNYDKPRQKEGESRWIDTFKAHPTRLPELPRNNLLFCSAFLRSTVDDSKYIEANTVLSSSLLVEGLLHPSSCRSKWIQQQLLEEAMWCCG